MKKKRGCGRSGRFGGCKRLACLFLGREKLTVPVVEVGQKKVWVRFGEILNLSLMIPVTSTASSTIELAKSRIDRKCC